MGRNRVVQNCRPEDSHDDLLLQKNTPVAFDLLAYSAFEVPANLGTW